MGEKFVPNDISFSDLGMPDDTADPVVLAAITKIPAVKDALMRIHQSRTRHLKDKKWGKAMRTIVSTLRSNSATVETNAMANALLSEQMVGFADEIRLIVDSTNQLLQSSAVYHLGMDTNARMRFFSTLVDPSSASANGLTPTETGKNMSVRKYSSTTNVATISPTDMLRVYLPSVIERNADNGAFLYIKGYEDKGTLGLILTQDSTVTVINPEEARWGHISSCFVLRNVGAQTATLGTVSATALSPSTKTWANLTQSSLVNYTVCLKDRNVRAVSQGRQISVRNDCSVQYYEPRSVSSSTQGMFDLYSRNVQDMSTTGLATTSPSLSTSRRLGAIQYDDPHGMGAQSCSPYFGRVTPDESSVACIVSLSIGSGYSSPPNVTIDPPPLINGVQYGVQAKAVAILTADTVTFIQILDHGHGYLQVPNITIDPPEGAGTAATALCMLTGQANELGFPAYTGACTPNVYYPSQVPEISQIQQNPSMVIPAGFKGQALPAGFPLIRPTLGANSIIRLGSINPAAVDDAQLILGVRWRVSGQVVHTWNTSNVGITQDTGMQYLYIFAIAESDNGTCYGFPHGPTCGKGQILIPTPWTGGATTRVPTPMPASYTGPGNSSGVQPLHYAVVNLNNGGTYNMGGAFDPTQGSTSIDVTIEIDNTQGERPGPDVAGTGFWSYAIGCANGSTNGGVDDSGRAALTTMNDAITDADGWSKWNRASAREFTSYKPFNIERCGLYAMVISSSINNGPPSGTGVNITDWSLGSWDLSGVTVEATQMRYQSEANDRIATLIASNQGDQQFGVQADINVLSVPLDSEIQAFPVPGDPVKTEDLCEASRSVPNAQVGRVITRGGL